MVRPENLAAPTRAVHAACGVEAEHHGHGPTNTQSLPLGMLIYSVIAFALFGAFPAALAAESWVSASDPRVQVVGRTRADAAGSRSFDWEGVSALVNVQGAT